MLLLNSVSIPRATFYHHKWLNHTRARNRSLARLKSSECKSPWSTNKSSGTTDM